MVVADDDVCPSRGVSLELVGTDVMACGYAPDVVGIKHVARGDGLKQGIVDRVVVASGKWALDGIAE